MSTNDQQPPASNQENPEDNWPELVRDEDDPNPGQILAVSRVDPGDPVGNQRRREKALGQMMAQVRQLKRRGKSAGKNH